MEATDPTQLLRAIVENIGRVARLTDRIAAHPSALPFCMIYSTFLVVSSLLSPVSECMACPGVSTTELTGLPIVTMCWHVACLLRCSGRWSNAYMWSSKWYLPSMRYDRSEKIQDVGPNYTRPRRCLHAYRSGQYYEHVNYELRYWHRVGRA